MNESVLLLDDGELQDVAEALENAGVDFKRLRGAQIEAELPPPLHLIVTTPRRARSVRRGSPPGAAQSRPLRVIVSDEDSGAMRRMLKRMGFHLLVRRPTHPETWRLLIQRAFCVADEEASLFPERRSNSRKHFKQTIAAEGPDGAHVLMGSDLSEGGMRIQRVPAIELGQRFTLAIYEPSRKEPIRVNAVVVRDDREHGFGLRFEKIDPATGHRLERLVGSLPDVERLEDGEAANLGAVVAEIVASREHPSLSATSAQT